MREIKFNFIYGVDGQENTYHNKTFTFSEIENGDHFDYISDSPLMRDYTIVGKRQYIGLKDKNGVEIYEGDIVIIERIYERADDYLDDGLFRIEWQIESCGFVAKEIDYIDSYDIYGYDLEVIGNIYEDSELLDD